MLYVQKEISRAIAAVAYRKKRDEHLIDKRCLGSPIQEKEKKAHFFASFFLSQQLSLNATLAYLYIYIFIYIYIYINFYV